MLDPNDLISIFDLRNARVANDELICSCPFGENHRNGDAHPSFGINLETGLSFCFGCGESNNLQQLANKLLGGGGLDAYRELVQQLDVNAIARIGEQVVPKSDDEIVYERECLMWARNKTDYWALRGFTEETIGKWQLGFDPESNRAVVPIRQGGKYVGYTKRAVGYEQPKWIHSKGFGRADYVFGLDDAQGDTVILVEAPLSVIMLDQQGVGSAIATFGCKMSSGQADIIRSRFNVVCICYDNDQAGYDGTKRAVNMLKDHVDVYISFPEFDDPAAQTYEQNKNMLSRVYPWWYSV